MTIFGQEVEQRTLWIAGGLLATGIIAVLVLRRQSAPSQAPQAPPPEYGSGGGGGGVSVPVPVTDQKADEYNQKLEGIQLQIAQGGLDYQKQLAGEQQSQFDLQQNYSKGILQSAISAGQAQYDDVSRYLKQRGEYSTALLPSEIAAGQAQYNLQASETGQQQKREEYLTKNYLGSAIKCPAGQEEQIDPQTGQARCVQKGRSFFEQIGDGITSVVNGIFQGAAQAAPGVTQAYIGAATGTVPGVGGQQQAQKPSPPPPTTATAPTRPPAQFNNPFGTPGIAGGYPSGVTVGNV